MEIHEKSWKFVKMSKNDAKSGPKSAKREPKGAKSEPKGSQREPKGSQREPKGNQREPKGSQMEPKVSQRATKMHPKIDVRKRSPKGSPRKMDLGSFWEPFFIKSVIKNRCQTNMKFDEKSMQK